MKIWSRFPVFRLLIPFSAGIICCFLSDEYRTTGIIITVAGFLSATVFTFRNYATGKYAQRWLAGIPFYLCFLGLGYTITWFHQTIHFSEHFSQKINEAHPVLCIVEITEPPAITKKGFQLTSKISFLKNQGKWQPVRGNLMIYLKDTLHSGKFKLGNRCLLKCLPQFVKPTGNPNAFDYSEYLKGKGIWHQAFVNSADISILESQSKRSIYGMAVTLRDLMLFKLQKFITSPDELGVAGALLLGYEDWLDPDLESSYTMAGVLHVLCVSGMHVGLIYAILAYLLLFMEKNKMLRHFRYILLIFFLWFYAMITGFTPSVIRASAMFTFVVMGKWMNREANIYNLLCSSCFLLFSMNPYILKSAGFQLSFLAVCGIVFVHPLIFCLFEAPNKILHKTWELISISIAAQITTFPLSLFLFHQFPNYFLVGNLLIIPLSTIVMYSGLIFLITDWIPYIGWVTGTITTLGINWLNQMVYFIGNLPGALTKNCFLSFYELLCLYIFMILFLLWIIFKWRSLMFSCFIVIITMLNIRICSIAQAEQQQLLTVYNSSKHSLISIIDKRKVIIFSDSSSDEKQISRITSEHLLNNLVQETDNFPITECVVIRTSKPHQPEILIVNGWKKHQSLKTKGNSIHPELLILGGELTIQPEKVLEVLKPRMVIFDSSCKKGQIAKLQEEFKKASIPTFDIASKGAFKYSLAFNRKLH